MGHRTVKRVPPDFDWPLNKAWKGYLNQNPNPECKECGGSGSRLRIEVDDYFNGIYIHLSALLRNVPLEVYKAITGRKRRDVFSPDSLDIYRLEKLICSPFGGENPSFCPHCDGKGSFPSKEYEEWQPEEPPIGEGWQLWETVSEGSPISPVFGTAGKLAGWCAENATWFADFKWSKEKWLEMFREGTEALETSTLLVVERKKSKKEEG